MQEFFYFSDYFVQLQVVRDFCPPPPLRVDSRLPGWSNASLGGDASLRWLWRGAGISRLGLRYRLCSCVASVASRSSLPDSIGRIWRVHSFVFLAVLLRRFRPELVGGFHYAMMLYIQVKVMPLCFRWNYGVMLFVLLDFICLVQIRC
jgi:hypothetical protein